MQQIVIVDDVDNNVEVLRAIVNDIPETESHGFTSSRDAMAWSNVRQADGFVIDYHMPEPNGLTMIRTLRANPRYRLTPIVVVTAEHEADVRLEALAAGANDFIQRPIERDEVLSRLRTLFALQAARSGLIERVEDLESSLQSEERRSRAQAERLATLWRVANTASEATDEAAIQAVLDEGAAGIRADQPFLGSLWRIEGETCVLIAAARGENDDGGLTGSTQPGSRVPLAELPFQLALRIGLPLSWDDVAAEPALATLERVRRVGVRAHVSVPFHVGDVWYALSFSSLEPMREAFRSDDHSYVSLLADFFATRIHRAEQSRRMRQQTDRLEALWNVANATYDPDDEDSLQAVLSEGAAAIRPGQLFFGCLMRVDGTRCILLAAARPDDISALVPASAPIGGDVPLDQMAEQFALELGSTQAWDDCLLDDRVASLARVRDLGERAMIVAPFEVGRVPYLLSFASRTPVVEPFGPDDHTYVKLLADFFATRIQRSEHAHRLLHHMSHDILTGLRNRTQFRLDARVQLAQHGAGVAAVVSLDGFRAINEEYGHIIGDALLVEVGAAIERRVAHIGVTGRLTGDTFGVFLNGVATEEDAQRRLADLQTIFTQPFSTGDREGKEFIPLSATVGGALAANAAAKFDDLLSHADTAVIAAKRRGRGQIAMYQAGMESDEGVRARTSAEIFQAIERREFELYFQPHLDTQSMRVTGAEALIRWNHPERGLVLPHAFIAFAERHGHIRAITRWVTAAALEAAGQFGDIDATFRLYFNLSAVDFTDSPIVDELRRARRAGAKLTNVGVELTETAAMQDLGAAARTVRSLQELGVRVAIDDFGTGYSGLALLKRLPVDLIKIDRSFVSEVLHGGRDAAIADTVIAGGRRLGYETVAEGVESEEQLAWLRSRGCRYVQGFAIAEPLRLGDFVRWLAARNPPDVVA